MLTSKLNRLFFFEGSLTTPASSDRELAVNTSLETGDWGYLATILAQETKRVGELETRDLIRLARLALEIDSPYVDTFRDAAIAKSPDAPEPYLAAYQLSVDRGEEYQESRAHEWLQKAVVLSGDDGPVQSMPLKEIVRRSSGWNKKVDNVSSMLAQARIPLYLAARALNRQPIEAILGLALRNSKGTDAKSQYPVLAFSGAKPRVDLSGVRVIALDLTALFTLDFLGLLQKTISAFDQIVIAPSTLSSLFFDKQFIRIRQPSEVAKAKQIKKLVSTGRLKLLQGETSAASSTKLDIDPDLQSLLDAARAKGAKVVRSAPVHKLHSFLEETVSLDSYNDVLTDTRSVLNLLSTKVDSATARNAETYLNQVDKGWDNGTTIDASSVVYLDQLSVTYLHHVGLLERLTDTVAAAYVSGDVDSHCDAVLQGAAMSTELGLAVDRIRAALNTALEKRANVRFSARRSLDRRKKGEDAEDEDPGVAFPSVDILSDLTDIDAIICDDRFLNKEPFWTDGRHNVPCASTIDVIAALNSRAVISEQQRHGLLHRLRVGSFYAVPLELDELKSELRRARIDGQTLEETPELTAIRQSLTIALRYRMHLESEAFWLDHSRLTIFQAIRTTWSEKKITPDLLARADWLLTMLPDPLAWCGDPTDTNKWLVAAQKSAAQMGMLAASPYLNTERQRKYGAWFEDRLANPARTHIPWLWDKAFQVFTFYIRQLTESKDASPQLRKALLAHVLRTLPDQLRKELLGSEIAAKGLGVRIRSVLTFNGTHSVDLVSFNNCLRAALKGRKSFALLLENGEKAKVQLNLKAAGAVTVSLDKLNILVPDGALLSENKKERTAALRRAFRCRPRTVDEERRWTKIAESRAFKNEEYGDLAQALRATPETLTEILSRPQTLGPLNMVPDDLEYFYGLAGPLSDAASLPAYIEGDLRRHRVNLLKKGKVGLRRLAYSALAQKLIPFNELAGHSLKDVEALLDAPDPFSLIFGFEVCREKLGRGDQAASQLGKKFLEKIFGDKKWLQERCEVFAACAVVSTVRLRAVVRDRDVPLYWFRLAALTHAGVLASSLSGLTKTADFMAWAIRDFGVSYTWYNAADIPSITVAYMHLKCAR